MFQDLCSRGENKKVLKTNLNQNFQEAIKLLSHYRDELLPQKVKENNGIYKKYNIEWIGREGLSPETHEEYLNDFI